LVDVRVFDDVSAEDVAEIIGGDMELATQIIERAKAHVG
jgi:HD-like signal output (HDOD) protein